MQGGCFGCCSNTPPPHSSEKVHMLAKQYIIVVHLHKLCKKSFLFKFFAWQKILNWKDPNSKRQHTLLSCVSHGVIVQSNRKYFYIKREIISDFQKVTWFIMKYEMSTKTKHSRFIEVQI